MNSAESAALSLVCKERFWQESADSENSNLVLINTCSVRVTAEKRTLGRIAHYAALKKKGRNFCLVIAGCMAQRLGGTLKEKFPQIDYVMGTSSRSFFPLILEAVEKGTKADADFCEDPVFTFSHSHLEEGQFRSFIPIMHGCNNFCSYCIVPYVRGREISRDPKNIAEEIRLVGERGVREITLLGQNVNSYLWEKDESAKVNFSTLMKIVSQEAQKSGIKWIRFLSANPRNFSTDAVRVMAENPAFCRHLHLPVQHGSNSILKAMNRGYSIEKYLELVKEIRSAMPEITLSTDILVGFPGETEDDVEKTLQLMEEVKFLYSFMYHFNPREGTAAYDLPDRIAEEVKKERLSRVIALQKKHTSQLLKSRIGSTETVLIEGISRKNADELITRTEKDEMVVVPGEKSMIGSFATVTLSSLKGNTFRGDLQCPGG